MLRRLWLVTGAALLAIAPAWAQTAPPAALSEQQAIAAAVEYAELLGLSVGEDVQANHPHAGWREGWPAHFEVTFREWRDYLPDGASGGEFHKLTVLSLDPDTARLLDFLDFEAGRQCGEGERLISDEEAEEISGHVLSLLGVREKFRFRRTEPGGGGRLGCRWEQYWRGIPAIGFARIQLDPHSGRLLGGMIGPDCRPPPASDRVLVDREQALAIAREAAGELGYLSAGKGPGRWIAREPELSAELRITQPNYVFSPGGPIWPSRDAPTVLAWEVKVRVPELREGERWWPESWVDFAIEAERGLIVGGGIYAGGGPSGEAKRDTPSRAAPLPGTRARRSGWAALALVVLAGLAFLVRTRRRRGGGAHSGRE
jgi:hypothetical protein